MGLLFADKYNITNNHAAPNYPQTINQTTHEHRAPTDDSVKLLREMEDASKESIVGMCQIEDNTLNGVVVIFMLSAQMMTRIAYIRFTFNGKEYVIKEELNQSFEFDRQAAVRMLFDAVKDRLFAEIYPDIDNALLKNIREAP